MKIGVIKLELFTDDTLELQFGTSLQVRSSCERFFKSVEWELQVINLTRQPELAARRNIIMLPTLDLIEGTDVKRFSGDITTLECVFEAIEQRYACLRMVRDAEKMVKS